AVTGVTLAKSASRHPRTPRYKGLSKTRILRANRASMRRVIVVLRNQHRALPATKHAAAARFRAVKADQAPLVAQVARSGGKVSHQYRVLNAFAARASTRELARLRGNRAVRSIVADSVVKLPATATRPKAKSSAAPTPTPSSTICPSDPAKPLLEPEALQT